MAMLTAAGETAAEETAADLRDWFRPARSRPQRGMTVRLPQVMPAMGLSHQTSASPPLSEVDPVVTHQAVPVVDSPV